MAECLITMRIDSSIKAKKKKRINNEKDEIDFNRKVVMMLLKMM